MQGLVRSEFAVPEGPAIPLDRFVRQVLACSWGDARTLLDRGKVLVDGATIQLRGTLVSKGMSVVVDPHNRQLPDPGSFPSAGRRRDPRHPVVSGPELKLAPESILYVDTHLVVANKPSGISTVPYEPGERGTFDVMVQRALAARFGTREGSRDSAREGVGVVHRIDKETSGLLVFTRTFAAKKIIGHQFRLHTLERTYIALVHGVFATAQTIHSKIMADRGDHLRGSARRPDQAPQGQEATTHVRPLFIMNNGPDGEVATAVACTLETGRTHQIRIHLSEYGHPVVGDRVYTRDWLKRGEEIIEAPRLMLHAAVLGFTHPFTEQKLRFTAPLPADMVKVLRRLSKGSVDAAAVEAEVAKDHG